MVNVNPNPNLNLFHNLIQYLILPNIYYFYILFLIECSKFNEYRINLFCNNKIFSKLDNFQKFFWLLTNEDSDILHIMGLYLHEHLN